MSERAKTDSDRINSAPRRKARAQSRMASPPTQRFRAQELPIIALLHIAASRKELSRNPRSSKKDLSCKLRQRNKGVTLALLQEITQGRPAAPPFYRAGGPKTTAKIPNSDVQEDDEPKT